MTKKLTTFVFIALSFFSVTLNAEIIFSAPPREKLVEGQKLYGPIAEQLSVLLGERVVYKHPGDWLTYSMNMRRGDYDLVFDGPQFAAWRMEHIEHVPLVRLNGHLGFFIVTKKDSPINDVQDLVAKKICGLASPNLATIAMLREFKNPVRQPIFVETKGGMKGVYKKLSTGKCAAAVMRDGFFNNKLPKDIRENYKIVWKSQRMPNQTITASKKIPAPIREQIVATLTTDKGATSASKLFQRFSKKSTRFVVSQNPEYSELNSLLEGVVWGW